MPNMSNQRALVSTVLADLKDKLQKRGGVMQMFHSVDTDNSTYISADEFAICLKGMGITLPSHQLDALISRFDANGDGNVSIPEFQAVIMDDKDSFDALKAAPAVPLDEQPSLLQSQPMLSPFATRAARPMTTPGETASAFLARMTGDIEERRRSAFIAELTKDPRFKPSMLEPPKPRFKEVTLEGGPIIKIHAARNTGLETRRPYKWGPLGGPGVGGLNLDPLHVEAWLCGGLVHMEAYSHPTYTYLLTDLLTAHLLHPVGRKLPQASTEVV